MNYLVLTITGLISLCVLFAVKVKRQEKIIATLDQQQKKDAMYFAIIEADENACHAAKSIAGKPIASTQAPILPLKNCSNHVCNCRYKQSA